MKKLMLMLALVAFATVSCTPESIETDEQQLDKEEYYIPPNG